MSADLDTQHELADLIRRVAVLAMSTEDGWTTAGPPGDQLHRATVSYEDSEFTLLCNDKGKVLVYTEREWDAFLDGVRKGEFDAEAGLVASPTEGSGT